MDSSIYKRWASVSGALAGGLAASACCVLPMVFLWLGVSGAWIANLTALSAYHTLFIGGAALLLAVSYYYIYFKGNTTCDEEALCAKPLPNKLVKGSFWLATLFIIIAAVFPYTVNYFYGV